MLNMVLDTEDNSNAGGEIKDKLVEEDMGYEQTSEVVSQQLVSFEIQEEKATVTLASPTKLNLVGSLKT